MTKEPCAPNGSRSADQKAKAAAPSEDRQSLGACVATAHLVSKKMSLVSSFARRPTEGDARRVSRTKTRRTESFIHRCKINENLTSDPPTTRIGANINFQLFFEARYGRRATANRCKTHAKCFAKRSSEDEQGPIVAKYREHGKIARPEWLGNTEMCAPESEQRREEN